MDRQLTYSDLNQALLEVAPELRDRFRDLSTTFDDPGPHLVFGGLLFTGYLLALLETEGRGDRLRDLFAFLEQMAESDDAKVGEVVGVTVCEYLSGHDFLKKSWPHMGPKTRQIAREIAVALGHPLPEDPDPYVSVNGRRYAERFREEIEKLGGPESATGVDVLNIRDRLLAELRSSNDV